MYIDKDALDAVELYLRSQRFEHLMPDGTEDHGDHGILRLRKTFAYYKVNKTIESDVFDFKVKQVADGKEYDVMTLRFSPVAIDFNARGIVTKVYCLHKYYPMDEEKPFCFDFQDYRWKP
ncbi:hypothetical protein [Thiorhodovibrio frisius]|uniref:Uncharacterized protein n=1 Tax=Thiorhodovibrio frisius TaxID=631362 RepID=H8Z3B0_9GAMM|nr:hypothetical protein [Thiorhodovibrio frisius]EIC21818.1 hypothetical protein Thi970DRAFT_02051 [Thiorhodovibrio frisius]WPL21787.1 hypothetical protein Thiofri_01920 [Thiorhodovibrio frisius]